MQKILCLLSLLTHALIPALAQENEDAATLTVPYQDAYYKPRIGLGAGVFTFFGEIRDNNFSHLFTSSRGFELNIARNISRPFSLELRVIHGNITVNQRGLENNLNFKSNIWNGSASITYNFYHLYKRENIVAPFISLGLGYLSFDSKTDLLNATGIAYNYWNDGTIRSLPQDATNAEEAVILQRDYDYETDLRELDLDGLGKYKLFSLNIPVAGGLNFKVGNRFNMRLAATYFINFTDMIDNISTAGEGNRKGNKANDNFIFTSLGLSYNLWGTGRTPRNKYFDKIDFYEAENEDSDSDGVPDFKDLCANTPADEEVDEFGCPLDGDKDYISGKQDKEIFTPASSLVNTEGKAYTDEMIAQEQRDSIAVPRSMIPLVYPSGTNSRKVSGIKNEDMEKLTAKVENIQKDMQLQDDLDNFFKSVSEEVKRKNISDPKEIENMVKSVESIYKGITNKELQVNKPTTATPEQIIGNRSTIPATYMKADYNNDGLLSPEEILRIVESFLDGTSNYTLAQVYDLIEYYEKNMKGIRVIDFGGTKGVYIDGKLNILPKQTPLAPETMKRRQLAKEFVTVDLDKNGEISPEEINSVIKLYQAGSTLYTKEMMNKLIDLFLE